MELSRRQFVCSTAFSAVVMPLVLQADKLAEKQISGKDEAAVPDYYDGMLEEVVARVSANAVRASGGFWFITDLHLFANHGRSGMLLVQLARWLPMLKKVFSGGDIPSAFSSKGLSQKEMLEAVVQMYREKWVLPLEGAGYEMYSARGNHDLMVLSNLKSGETYRYSDKEIHDVIMGTKASVNTVGNSEEPLSCYYYRDDESERIRYIVLDTTDSMKKEKNGRQRAVSGIGVNQLKWLAEKALPSVRDGWSVVLVHHIPITGVVGNDSEFRRFESIRSLLVAYQHRGKVSAGGHEYDFANAKGRIFMSISGHHHCEAATFHDGILFVTEPCDAAYSDYITRSKTWCGELPVKKKGTVAEQTFDAVQLNVADELAYFTRIGGGQHRVYHTRAWEVKVGQTLKLEATLLQGTVTWGCHDGDRAARRSLPKQPFVRFMEYSNKMATVTKDGVLTAIAPGPVMLLAMDERLNKEVFPITVTE